jgi:adenylate cyclase class 2
MPYEIEIKFRVEDHDALARRLLARGAREQPGQWQSDLYLAHPARDFAGSGEAFRVRSEAGRNHLTYKGPRHAGPTKTREEIEVAFAGGAEGREAMVALLERLGFRPVHEVRKRRTAYACDLAGRSLTVALDRVDGLGDFAEVETLAATPEDLPAAQAAVTALAAKLGLSRIEPRSYLRMALEGATAG